MNKVLRTFKRRIIFFLICAVLLGLSIHALEAGPCEHAFFKCFYQPFMPEPAKSIYCSVGYLFCKKYIEKAMH